MTTRIFESGFASEEETEDVMEILRKNKIRFYETPGGYPGRRRAWFAKTTFNPTLAMPATPAALWVVHQSDYEKARELIDAYEQARSKRVRRELGPRRASLFPNIPTPAWLFLIALAMTLLLGIVSGYF